MDTLITVLMQSLGLPADPVVAAAYVWVFALALGLVVSLVVMLLLWRIHREAMIINDYVSRVWDAGQRVANNTIHIPTLYAINDNVDQIQETALRISDGAAAIETHANGCPGCPDCMLQHQEAN